jgi:hypothetical protein
MLRDAERDHRIDTPRRTKVAERPKVHGSWNGFYPAAAVDNPAAFRLRKHSRQ